MVWGRGRGSGELEQAEKAQRSRPACSLLRAASGRPGPAGMCMGSILSVRLGSRGISRLAEMGPAAGFVALASRPHLQSSALLAAPRDSRSHLGRGQGSSWGSWPCKRACGSFGAAPGKAGTGALMVPLKATSSPSCVQLHQDCSRGGGCCLNGMGGSEATLGAHSGLESSHSPGTEPEEPP